jgi:hypothetical protein
VAAELEATRLHLLKEANEVTKAQRLLEQTLDEYNSVYRLTPTSREPSHRGDIRCRGGDLDKTLAGDDDPIPPPGASRPTYSSPVKNLKVAEFVAAGLDGLEGEELHRQHQCLRELITTANRQQEEHLL